MPARKKTLEVPPPSDPLELFHPAARDWFLAVFDSPTRPQELGWPAIAKGDSTLILAPTGTGKTLTAFMWCINRLMFEPVPEASSRCRIIYISPIKALAVDVERNLRSPLVGITQAAERMGFRAHQPSIAIRTGDTPPAERAKFARHPADILITTPESLYLLLTSNARTALSSVETVIIDEIHALVPTKRGSHLALSLERLEHFVGRPLQRIGLSATQRPLEEVAQYLGGAEAAAPAIAPVPTDGAVALESVETESSAAAFRPVTIVDAGERKRLELRVEVPIEDMARLGEIDPLPSGPASQGPVRPSIWSAIHPKLLELVQQHQSTLIFVNSRRLAERISGAINELAGETLVRAHHGSVALAQRKEIEDRLKMGTLRGLVATSSLELGIDMGAVDLVIQIESPPSVASGMQRIGRASHRVGAVSKGIIFPKFRADLVACAAVTRAMYEGQVESVHYPRNPLDVLAQQVAAMVAMDPWNVEDLFARIRQCAPYSTMTRPVFESVLDMLAGRYPSDEFAELRPRITWDRVNNMLTPREGTRRVAVVNGGTIPDRGLYGVFLAGSSKPSRVGELDEEMVFESRTGDTIILGASTWRIEQITHDRVLVSPAPGEPGKMPFWHGDTAGRPAEFGERIGKMTRELLKMPRQVAFSTLVENHSLDQNAAENVMRYLEEQVQATGRVPSDEDILIERCRDELGDWRICVLTPFGARVHAPWVMAVTAKLAAERGIDSESMWSDDGFVLRIPENEEALDLEWLIPTAGELRDLVLRQLASTSLFAAKFRECAARALLLPKRVPGKRAPLWQQRRRAADLLTVASRYASFPILLETYRECIRDVFDLAAAVSVLRKIQSGQVRVTRHESVKPSPFASALLFSYVANYIYDGDAPLAERRAQALSIDQSQLQELLGDYDLRELLDAAALDEVESQLQMTDPERQARHKDAVHDMLLRLGDLNAAELEQRCASEEVAESVRELQDVRRVLQVRINHDRRYIAVEDGARYRDAFGIPLPPGLPEVWLTRSEHPLLEIVRRYARTHGPFTAVDLAGRYGVPPADIEPLLHHLHAEGKLVEGEFRPSGTHREWCDPEVLRIVRRKTLARLRKEIEPVDQRVLGRLLTRWQGVTVRRRGPEALLDAIAALQGVAVPASDLEREILRSRVEDYRSTDLDTLIAAGQVVWVGVERLGDRDGRVALYLAENIATLLPPQNFDRAALSEKAQQVLAVLERGGAQFFHEIRAALGGGFPDEITDALWELVWNGLITNDTFHAVRALRRPADPRKHPAITDAQPGSVEFLRRVRAKSGGSVTGQGRWSVLRRHALGGSSDTAWSADMAQQMLTRYGIVTREAAAAESLPGGYGAIYPALRTMEDSGWIRRGMFIAGLGAAQFAMNSAVDLLRSLRRESEKVEAIALAASDPANPYGAILPWPRTSEDTPHGMARVSGASVILVNGSLAAFFRRRNPSIRVFLPEDEPERTQTARALALVLAEVAIQRQEARSGLMISEISGEDAKRHFLGRFLVDAGFVETALGYQMRRVTRPSAAQKVEEQAFEVDEEHEPSDA